jgi:peptidoglycan/LPS O-acetylase OafA/YrhL
MVVMPAPTTTTASPCARQGLGYLPGLDGVRAIAVAAVIVYHGNLGFNTSVDWLPAGFLGVDMFFVLSGYLITTLLLVEWKNDGHIRFKRFYIHRARRLLPALFLMLAGTTLLAAMFGSDAVPGIRRDLPGALFYVANWWQLGHHQSYFELIGRPPLLQHLWSLAIEEQFYLLWPLLFVFGLRRWGSRNPRLLATVFGGAVLSAMLMAAFAHQTVNNNYDASNVYLATHTHMMGLLTGAALALVWRPWQLSRHTGRRAPILLDLAGLGALAWTLYIMANTDIFATWPYARGGFLFFSIITAVLIASIVHPAAHMNRLLGLRPLRWLGERSYGIYLWHWPIMMLTRQQLDVTWVHGIALFVLQVMLTLLVAALSYTYVEYPIRHGALGRYFAQLRGTHGPDRRRLTGSALRATTAGLVALLLVTIALFAGHGNRRIPGLTNASAAATHVHTTRPSVAASTPATTPPTRPGVPPPTTGPPAPAPNVAHVTALGDSVMLGAAHALQRTVGDITIDATVSRHTQEIVDIAHQLHDANQLGPVVVIHTGTNGVVLPQQLDDLFTTLKDVPRVVIVNLKVPRTWEQRDNDAIASEVPGHPNVRVVDWHDQGDSHPEWFVDDGVHLTNVGQDAYARLINEAVTAP